MRNRTLPFLTLLFCFNSIYAQTFVDLGHTGYEQSENFQLVPTTFGSAKVQTIITTSELLSAGLTSGAVISGISYYVQTDHTPGTITVDWFAGLTATSSFASTSFEPAPISRGSSSDAGTINNAWRNITLFSSITWDGTSDLIIQACRTSAGQGNSDEVGYLNTSSTSFISGYLYHNCSDNSGEYVQAARPQIGLSFTPATTLAFSFISLNATQQRGFTDLSWKVTDEKEIISFEVERSASGTGFQKVATIDADNKGTYEWRDMLVGNFIYRVKSIYSSGKSVYSRIIKTAINSAGSDFVIAPNPVSDNKAILQLNSFKQGNYSYAIINLSGQTVQKGVLYINEGNSVYTLNLVSSIMSGLYTIQLKNDTEVLVHTKMSVVR